MCSVSKVDQALGGLSREEDASPAVAIRTVSANEVRHNRLAYYVVDVRERGEVEVEGGGGEGGQGEDLPPDVDADAAVPMGEIFRLAQSKGSQLPWEEAAAGNRTTVVLLSGTGHRATVTARELARCGRANNVAVLQRGVLALRDPAAAAVPDVVVVLGRNDNAEKITLALSACASAAAAGESVVLVLMSDGVWTFLRKGSNKDDSSSSGGGRTFRVAEACFVGDPFQPCDVLLRKFLETGRGTILGCSSCVKARDLEFGSDLMDCVRPMQLPDLLRMLGEAKKNLQFT